MCVVCVCVCVCPQEEMTYKGVVFNEMKGVYSSPDSVYYREVQRALFPDNTYRYVRVCACVYVCV